MQLTEIQIYSLDFAWKGKHIREKNMNPKYVPPKWFLVKYGDEFHGIESVKNHQQKQFQLESNCKSIDSASYFCDIKAWGHS